MKKILYLLIAVFAITACQKDPDFSDLSTEFSVFTTYDGTYSFSTPTLIYVPDRILLIDNSVQDDTYWDDAFSDQIIARFTSKLEDAGYQTTSDPEAAAQLNLNLSYIEDVNFIVEYPYWWWDPIWWDGGFWPDWYYPYPVVYGYTIGSMIGELVVPNADALEIQEILPTVWYTYISGEEFGDESVVTPFILRGIDQAFIQSPEVQK